MCDLDGAIWVGVVVCGSAQPGGRLEVKSKLACILCRYFRAREAPRECKKDICTYVSDRRHGESKGQTGDALFI